MAKEKSRKEKKRGGCNGGGKRKKDEGNIKHQRSQKPEQRSLRRKKGIPLNRKDETENE